VKDAIGQDINVGDKVVSCSGKRAGDTNVYTITKVTAKRIQYQHTYSWDKDNPRIINLDPTLVINVTSNLNALENA